MKILSGLIYSPIRLRVLLNTLGAALALVIALATIPGTSIAQDAPTPTVAHPTTESIRASELGNALQELRDYLAELPPSSIEEMTSPITEIYQQIKSTPLNFDILSTRPVHEIVQEENRLSSLITKLESYKGELKGRIEHISSLSEHLNSRLSVWKGSLKELAGNQAIQPILETARSSVRELNNLALFQSQRLKGLFEEQSRLITLEKEVANLKEKVSNSRVTAQQSLLLRDASSLLRSTHAETAQLFSWTTETQKMSADISDWSENSLPLLALSLIIPIGLTFAFKRNFTSVGGMVLLGITIHLGIINGALIASSILFPIIFKASLLSTYLYFCHSISPLWLRTLLKRVGFLALIEIIAIFVDSSPSLRVGILMTKLIVLSLIAYSTLPFVGARLKNGKVPQTLALIAALTALMLMAGYWRLGLYIGEGLLFSSYMAALCIALGCVTGMWLDRLPYRISTISRNLTTEQIAATIPGLKILCFAFLVYTWVYTSLDNMKLQNSAEQLVASILSPEFMLGSVHLSPARLFLVGLTIWLGFKLSIIIRTLFKRASYTAVYLQDPGIVHSLTSVIHYCLLTAATLVALNILGVSLEKLALIAGALSLGAGFGLQHIVSNFVSGLILLWERPIRLGDSVVVDGVAGTVQRIGLRSSVLKSGEDADVFIPNSRLISERVINLTRSSPNARLSLQVHTPRNVDINQVMSILLTAVESTDGILQSPAPDVLYKGSKDHLADFSISFSIANVGQRGKIESNLLIRINEELAENLIPTPRPIFDVNLVANPSGIK